MNNYGLILNYVGMEGMFDALLRDYIKPLASVLYPKVRWTASVDVNDFSTSQRSYLPSHQDYGRSIDHHHTFLVQYKADADLSLDMHIDDSEVSSFRAQRVGVAMIKFL
jgi:hypothetical protein